MSARPPSAPDHQSVAPDGSAASGASGAGGAGGADSGTAAEGAPHTMAEALNEALLEAHEIAEARKASVLDTAIDAIVAIDADGRFVEFNPAAEAMFGYTREAVMGKLMAELIIPPTYREEHRAGLTRYLASGEARMLGRRTELAAQRANGEEFPIELVITRVPLPGPPAFTAYIRDLTDRKALEAEREQLLQEQILARRRLEEQAAQLTAQANDLEIASADLRDINERLLQAVQQTSEARHAAEAANMAKNEFLAVISHELRTPLTAIIGYEELLADGITGPVTEAQRDQLHRIKISANHLLFLIDQILTVARIDVGKEQLTITRFPLRTAIDNARSMVEPKAIAKGLGFTVHDPPESLMIETDAGKLQQILVNLWSNAIEYTNRGAIHLDVQQTGDHVMLSVSDTGIGIAPEHLSRIFDPFWQVERHSTRRHGGVGLGLNVTRRLSRLLGGEVTVTSVQDKGSTFVVRLPLLTPPLPGRRGSR